MTRSLSPYRRYRFAAMCALGVLLFAGAQRAGAAGKTVDAPAANIVSDGTTLNTTAIQHAIDDLSASGGGVLHFPAGKYLTGTVQIKSNVTLHLDQDATILGSTDVADYRNLDPFIDGSGNPLGHAMIVSMDAEHVGIDGLGTIDGQGARLAAKQKPYAIRPFLVRWVRCSDVTLRDVHLANPGAWTLNFFQSKGALLENVTIRSRDQKLRNNDGVNIDSSENIQVRNCDIISGDDALVIKSTAAGKPSRHISAENCKLSTHTNAIKLGTEGIGGFADITVSHCQITNTDMSGIAIYSVDGGDLQNVSISDVSMDGVMVPISIRRGTRLKTFRQGDQAKASPGRLSDITIKNVSATNIKLIGMLINGVPGYPVESLTLTNISLELPGGGSAEAGSIQLPEKEAAYPEYNMFGKVLPAWGVYARHVRGIVLDHVHVNVRAPDGRSPILFLDVQDVTPADFPVATTQPASPRP